MSITVNNNKKISIAVIGCVEFSESALNRLIANEHCEICLVITRQSSSINSDFRDLGAIAQQHDIPVLNVIGKDQTEMCHALRTYQPDVVFCVGWSYLLKAELLAIPPFGVIGYHPAAIPANRGRHPLIWAIALGLQETASSFFLMDEGADSGKILSQKPISISDSDYAIDLYRKMTVVALNQIDEMLSDWHTCYSNARPQVEAGNIWRKRGKSDGRIDWRMSARNIMNLIRALSEPYPGAHIEYQQQDFLVWRAHINYDTPNNIEPGKIVGIGGNTMTVKCGEHAITLTQFDPILGVKVGSYL